MIQFKNVSLFQKEWKKGMEGGRRKLGREGERKGSRVGQGWGRMEGGGRKGSREGEEGGRRRR